MSAAFLVFDVLIGAIVLRFAWPALDAGTQLIAVIFGCAILFWKWTRF
jgi:hypothetical protein